MISSTPPSPIVAPLPHLLLTLLPPPVSRTTAFHGVAAQVTDASLEAIGKHCRGLESLALQGCDMITDKGFAAMLRGCPNITVLNLRGVSDLTEVSTQITFAEANFEGR